MIKITSNGRIIQMLVYVLLVMSALSTPAAAQYAWNGFQLNGSASNPAWAYNGTVADGTVNGGVYIDCGHGADYANPPDGYVQEFNVPAHNNVVHAYLYGGVWHGTENHKGKLNLYFNNSVSNQLTPAGGLALDGASDTNSNVWCTSHGVTWFFYNVTTLVQQGVNTANGYTSKVDSGFDGRIYGFKLVVVYEKDGASAVQYWLNQGHDALTYATSGHPERNTGTAHFDGTAMTDPQYAMLYSTWLTGDPGDSDTLKFNNNVVDSSCTNYEQGAYLDSRWYVLDVNDVQTSGNYVEYDRDTDNYVHWVGTELVLFSETPKPDLVVSSMDDPVLVGHDSTHGYVVGHYYTVDATIKNQGNAQSPGCNVALYEAGSTTAEHTVGIGSLSPGSSQTVTLNWHSDTSGNVELKVTADSSGGVTESDETNNDRIEYVNVLTAGNPDLAISTDDIAFLPTWESDDTTIQVTVLNDGTGDANNFVVEVYNGASLIHTSQPMNVAAKGDKVISYTHSFAYGGSYSIRADLDAGGAVTESDENNNEATRDLNVIEVMLWISHHHGNTSTYNGEYSGFTDVVMFKEIKLVPKDTTPWDALNSEAVVTPQFGPDFEIDGLIEDPSGPIYWYLYFNGRYVPDHEQWKVIKLLDGETMHWDFQKQVYTASDSFTPPCTVQSYPAGDDLYPEPFTHGFPMNLGSGDGHSRTVWDTVIVYPAGSTDFQTLAGDIKSTLEAGGVPTGKISTVDNASISTYQKENCNLILIGSYTANSLIAEVNPQHEQIGMPAYFDYTSCAIMEDDDDPTTSLPPLYHGAVVEAFDNPWNNGAHVDSEGSMILMASGLNDGDAKDAANMLIGNTGELNKFWRVRQMMCGDVTLDNAVNIFDAMAVYDGNYMSRRAADVDCNDKVNIFDVMGIYDKNLNCCEACIA